MVSWMAFVGSIAAAASLADVLGASLRGRRFAAIFGATLPAAITQATGSMNDIVVAFWVLSAILMLLYYVKKSQKPLILVLSALAAALAVLTKATALIFLLPFALYAVVALWKRLGMGADAALGGDCLCHYGADQWRQFLQESDGLWEILAAAGTGGTDQ